MIDSLQEIPRVAEAAKKYGKTQSVMIRLNPGVEAHTLEAIATAHTDVKFGLSIASGMAWDAAKEIAKYRELDFRGVHAHIGSQIFGSEAFEIAAERLLKFMARYRDAYGTELPELDMGGGFGIAYVDSETTVEPTDVLPAMGAALRKNAAELSLHLPHIS